MRLGDVVTLQRGFDLPHRERREGPVPIVSSSGITGRHDEARVNPPAVITGRYGTLGEVYYVDQPCWPLNTTLFVKDFHGNDPRFCYYLLQNLELASHEGAAAVPGVNRNVLHELPTLVPSGALQRKLVAILAAFDDLVDTNASRINILDEMCQRIYREWFVDFRYPGHEGGAAPTAASDGVPAGWDVSRTADLIASGTLAIGDGYRAKNAELGNEGLPFVRIADLRDDFDFDGVDRLRSESMAAVGAKVSRPGDCVVLTKGTVGRVFLVPVASEPFVYSPQLSYWRILQPTLAHEYLFCWMRGPDFARQCAHVKGATDMADYVNLRDQRNMLIPVPPLSIQTHFSEVVGPVLDLIANLWRASRNARAMRDMLLPRLISGKIDVADLDIEVEEPAA